MEQRSLVLTGPLRQFVRVNTLMTCMSRRTGDGVWQWASRIRTWRVPVGYWCPRHKIEGGRRRWGGCFGLSVGGGGCRKCFADVGDDRRFQRERVGTLELVDGSRECIG